VIYGRVLEAPPAAPSGLVPVGIVPRVIAFVLDYVPAAFLPFIVLAALQDAGVTVQDANDDINALGWLLLVVSWIAYFALCWATVGTPAMRILGMRVVSAETGKRISITAALVRSVVFTIGLFAVGIGSLWALWDPQRRTLQDKAAGSVIVWGGSGAVKILGGVLWRHPTA
jgi:uncharacterized RDD family membrane protein YckC